MLRLALLPGLLALFVAACEGKVRDQEAPDAVGAPAAPAAPAASAAAAGAPVTCRLGDEIPERDRKTIEGHAVRVITGLRGGAAQPLWNDLHPSQRRPEGHEPFLAALGGLQERLRGNPADAQLLDAVLVDVVPGVEENLRIRCGRETEDPADDLLISSQVAGERIALVRLEVPGPAITEGLVVRLQEHRDQWYLVSVEGNPLRVGTRDASAFEAMADQHREAGRVIPAYLQYGLAQLLSARGAGVVTPAGRRINDKLQATADSAAFQAATRSVETPSGPLELIRLGLRTSPAGVGPNIKYVTARALDDADGITAEAGALVRAFQAAHPAIAETFDTALVEAYRERPTDPTRRYDAFQTVVTLRTADAPPPG